MKLIWLCVLLAVAVRAAPSRPSNSEKVRYDGYKVYKLHIKNKAQLGVIELIEDLTEKYNIWKEYDQQSQEVHIMVKPEELSNFSSLMKVYNFNMEIMIDDVQQLIDAEQSTDAATAATERAFGWTRYNQLHEIEAWLDSILETYPDVTEGFTIGQSYEGRNIRGIKISHNPSNPAIFIESNIHAREWITSATATWFINELLTSEKQEVKNLAESYNWYIIPVYNVDGFVYSHERDRLWRKTRQPVSTSDCIGTDANRNFDSHWMENGGASANPCSQSYAGPQPFSEPEAKALADFVTSIKDDVAIYLSFHSYGQYLLSPYGHSKEELPENYPDLLDIGTAFHDAIQSLPYKTEYRYGSTGSVLYVASGVSVDYMFNELDIKVGFTIEYRDTGRYGFVLPPIQILPNCEELMAGMLALVDKSKQLGYV